MRKLLLLLLIPLLFSCANYGHLKFRKTDVTHQKKETPIQEEAIKKELSFSTQEHIVDVAVNDNDYIEVSASNKTPTFGKNIKINKFTRTEKDGGCDVILLRTGEEIEAKVSEVGINEIKYKRCDNIEGPSYTILKKDVFMITYSNGSKDVFREEPKEVASNNQSNQTPTRKTFHAGGVVGFIFAMIAIPVSLFVSWPVSAVGILSIIFGSIAIGSVSRHRDTKRGLGMGILSLIFGILLVGLFIVMAAVVL